MFCLIVLPYRQDQLLKTDKVPHSTVTFTIILHMQVEMLVSYHFDWHKAFMKNCKFIQF